MASLQERLERGQVGVYALAIAAGATLGLAAPEAGAWLATALWPLLAVLLFVSFLQVPLAHLGGAAGDRRFLGALLAGNFVAVPALVWGLSHFLPDDASMRLGFFLVLLVPCTDWFITFTLIGRGDGRLALASTPVLLLSQMALLPVFLWLFLGSEATLGMRAGPFLQAFGAIILAPLVLAYGIERSVAPGTRAAAWVARTVWLPIPLLALVIFVIAASEIGAVLAVARDLARVVALFVLYLILAPLVAVIVARSLGVRGAKLRTVIFSLGTRNSFVVLPLALAWPGAGVIASSVVVIQSLVELCGMLAYLAIVPRYVPDDATAPPGRVGAK